MAGEQYAIEARFVQAVIALPPLALLPHAPPQVAGLASRAGLVFPVFHLSALLDVPQAPQAVQAAAPGRVIVAGDTGCELGLLVSAVVAVRPMEMETLRPPPSDLGTGARAIVRGMGPDGVLVLDGAVLLASESLYVDIPLPAAMRQT